MKLKELTRKATNKTGKADSHKRSEKFEIANERGVPPKFGLHADRKLYSSKDENVSPKMHFVIIIIQYKCTD